MKVVQFVRADGLTLSEYTFKGGSFIEIQYRNAKVKKLCTDYRQAQKELNATVAERLHSLINVLESADNLQDIYDMRMYHLHPLSGDREGQYALDLGRRSGYRLIIKPLDEQGNERKDKDLNVLYKTTKIVLVWEVSKHYE